MDIKIELMADDEMNQATLEWKKIVNEAKDSIERSEITQNNQNLSNNDEPFTKTLNKSD